MQEAFNFVPFHRLDRHPTEQGDDVTHETASAGDQRRFRLGCQAELSTLVVTYNVQGA
jgi:hypothetical protein